MNDNKQERQISPEEIQRVQRRQLTKEQLQQVQQTQVLNIKELERTARYERITSKKPALIVAILGIVSILMGTTFQVVDNLSAKRLNESDINKRTTEINNTQKLPIQSYLACNKILSDPITGTDKHYNINFVFENDELRSYTKVFRVVAMENNPTGLITVQDYIKSFEGLKNITEGYNVNVNQTEKDASITTIVDYKVLDVTKIVPIQNDNDGTKLEFNTVTTKEQVKQSLATNAYICQ